MNAALDYRFAWLWLMPEVSGHAFTFVGFDREEQSFVLEKLGGLASRGGAGDVLFVNADKAGLDEVAPHVARAGLLAVVGHGRQCKRLARMGAPWTHSRSYALLPSAVPRLAVPLQPNAAARAGMALHRPGRRIARLAVALAAGMLRFGNSAMLERRLVVLCSKIQQVTPKAWGGLADGSAPPAFALYFGNPVANRKTVVLEIPEDEGHDRTILKVAFSESARLDLEREAAALARMQATVLRDQVPRCLSFVRQTDQVTLRQTYRQRLAASDARMRGETIRFLAALAKVSTRSQALETAIASQVPGARRARVPGLLELLQAEPATATLVRVLSHGDFTAWNCSWTREGYFVFDWESAREDGIFLEDAAYFVFSDALHVTGSDADQALRDAMTLAREVAQACGFPDISVRRQVGAWLLEKSTTSDHALYALAADALVRRWKEYA